MNLMRTIFFVITIWIAPTFAIPRVRVNDKLLHTIEQYIDVSEDPCYDFFAYACGKWSSQHKTERYSESTTLVDHKMNKRLVHLLESYIYGQNTIMDKIWIYYKSCRRERKYHPIRYLKVVKSDKKLNWPLLQKRHHSDEMANRDIWTQKNKNINHWLTIAAKLRRYGFKNPLIEHLVLQNITDSSQYLIDLDMPENTNVSQLPEDDIFLVALFHNLGVDQLEIMRWIEKLKCFEKELIELKEDVMANHREYDGDDNADDDDDEIVSLTLKEIQELIPDWPWRQYFQIIFSHRVPEDFKFHLRMRRYFIELVNFLNKTDPELICNYLMIEFLLYLNMDKSPSADKIDCVIDLRSKMDLAINYIYAFEMFENKTRRIFNRDVKQIVEIIRGEFDRKLDENINDLTIEEREYLKEKLHAMDVVMGNLPHRVDEEFVVEHYEGIELLPKNYYRNHLKMLELKFQREHYMILHGRPDIDEYFFIADTDTARSSTPFYLVRQNLIVVPYGFLQTPIYHHNMYNVLKYSLLGFNLAHEIAHGFDASGVLYNRMGSLSQIGVNITENMKFAETLNCMQREETNSVDERIADIVGIRLAYDAFFNSEMGEVVKNRNFNRRSAKEIFFLNVAQFFCGNLAFEFVDHDSDNVRLQETLLNFEPFAETFNCSVGETMNPEEICRLW